MTSRRRWVTAGDLAAYLSLAPGSIRAIASRARREGIELRRNNPGDVAALYDLDQFVAYVDARPGKGWRRCGCCPRSVRSTRRRRAKV